MAVATKPAEMKSLYVKDSKYSDFMLNKGLLRNVASKGYVHPTQIQNMTIENILQGKDLLGLASTGSGKTGAFLIPLIESVVKDRKTKILIIAPTRELATQIYDELSSLTKDLGIYGVTIVGGMSAYNQINKLRRGPHFIIGTPGRLKDLTDRGYIPLQKIRTLVIDEVDRMLDMGFIDDIEYITNKMPEKKQTILFSATMDKKTEIIVKKFTNNYERV
jgi:superfamily II DNA/RNA helicase